MLTNSAVLDHLCACMKYHLKSLFRINLINRRNQSGLCSNKMLYFGIVSFDELAKPKVHQNILLQDI